MDYKEEFERHAIGKAIAKRINDAIDGEFLEDIFPAMCWILGALGTEANINKEAFLVAVHNSVSTAYDANIRENDDATTH